MEEESLGKKIKNTLIQGDGASIRDYIVLKVIIPAVQNTIANTIKSAVDIFFYGNARVGNYSGGGSGSKISYQSYYDNKNGQQQEQRKIDNGWHPVWQYSEIEFDSEGSALVALTQLDEIFDRYQKVEVADLYDVADRTPAITDHGYGWKQWTGVNVYMKPNGKWSLTLPKATPIK